MRTSTAHRGRAAQLTTGAGVAALLLTLLSVPATDAGFTDSTFGRATLTTTAGLDSPPVDYDQSAASSLFISRRGDLYISGARGNGNGNGGTPPATAAPERVAFPAGTVIVDAAGSTNDFSAAYEATSSYMALDAEGGVWTWGAPYPGRGGGGQRLLGRGELSVVQSRTAGRVTTTIEGTPLPPIAEIARVENQFLALDREGSLWAWGYGGENLPNPAGAISAPLPVRADHTTLAPQAGRCDQSGNPGNLGTVRWRSLWGGNNAAGAVGRNGLVYSWGFDTMQAPADGLDRVSALCPGLNERANRALFHEFPELYRTTAGLTYDEATLPDETSRHGRYLEIVQAVRGRTLPECTGTKGSDRTDGSACPVRQLAFPARATLLLTRQGRLLSWKSSLADYGDPFLGRARGGSSPSPHWPAPVLEGAAPLAVDGFTTGIGSVTALSRDGRALGWGWNNYCQAIGAPTGKSDCAAPRDTPQAGRDLVALPTPVAGIPASAKVTAVASTQCASWATMESGELYAWGAGTVAGRDFRYCSQPAGAQAGYKIHDYSTVDGAYPFGKPVTARATATLKVAG